jgi:hypothetical protein
MAVLAASGIASLLPFLLVIACPLMMVVMMKDPHAGGGHGETELKSREEPGESV